MNADAGENQIRCQAQTVVEQHALDLVLAKDLRSLVFADELHPVLFVQGANRLAHGLAELLGKRDCVACQHGDVEAELAQGRRAFEGNKTVADDHRALARLSGVDDLFSLGFRTQDEDVGQLGTRQLQRIGRATGGEYSGVVAQDAAVVQMECFAWGVE